MLTRTQKMRRKAMLKAVALVLLAGLIFTPRLDAIQFPDLPFGLVSPVEASEPPQIHGYSAALPAPAHTKG